MSASPFPDPPAGDAAAPPPESLSAVLAECAAALAAAGVADAELDATLLACHVLGASRGRVQAMAMADAALGAADAVALRALAARRATREPLQHITGIAVFRALELEVGPGVFVPRPETEMVAQLAIDALMQVASAAPVAVDLGTGSGAIGLAMATEVPHAEVSAVELSSDAFAWAERNRRRVGARNIRLVLGDLATALPELDGRVDVLVSNPPYVPSGAVPVDPEVHRHDPHEALYGGDDGLDVIRVIAVRALRLVRRGGTVIIEHAETQGSAVRSLLTEYGWHAAATHPDLTGRDRATTAIR